MINYGDFSKPFCAKVSQKNDIRKSGLYELVLFNQDLPSRQMFAFLCVDVWLQFSILDCVTRDHPSRDIRANKVQHSSLSQHSKYLLALLKWQLILSSGLEVVQRHEQLRVSVLVLTPDQEVLSGGPPEAGPLQRVEEAEAGEVRQLVLWRGHFWERAVLEQRLWNVSQ